MQSVSSRTAYLAADKTWVQRPMKEKNDDDDDDDDDDGDDDDDDDDGDDDDDNLGVVGEPGAHVAVGQPVIFAPAGSVWYPVLNNKVARLFL